MKVKPPKMEAAKHYMRKSCMLYMKKKKLLKGEPEVKGRACLIALVSTPSALKAVTAKWGENKLSPSSRPVQKPTIPAPQPNWTLLKTLTGHGDWVRALAQSPDRKLLASASSDKTVKLWRLSDGALLKTFVGHTDSVYGVTFNKDGSLIVSGSKDKSIRVWDVQSGRQVRKMTRHRNNVNQVLLIDGGTTLATTSDDKQLVLWDTKTWKVKRSTNLHKHHIYTIAISPDGKFGVTGGGDFRARVWSASDGKFIEALQHGGWVNWVDFSNDGKFLATASSDGKVGIFNGKTHRHLRWLSGHTDKVRGLDFHPSSHLLVSGGDDRMIRFWNAATGASRGTLAGHTDRVMVVMFTSDGKLLITGSADKSTRIWGRSTPTCRSIYSKERRCLDSLAKVAAGNPSADKWAKGGEFWRRLTRTDTNATLENCRGYMAAVKKGWSGVTEKQRKFLLKWRKNYWTKRLKCFSKQDCDAYAVCVER